MARAVPLSACLHEGGEDVVWWWEWWCGERVGIEEASGDPEHRHPHLPVCVCVCVCVGRVRPAWVRMETGTGM